MIIWIFQFDPMNKIAMDTFNSYAMAMNLKAFVSLH